MAWMFTNLTVTWKRVIFSTTLQISTCKCRYNMWMEGVAACRELVVHGPRRHVVHTRRRDVRASAQAANRRLPAWAAAVHPRPARRRARPLSSALQPDRLVVGALCRARPAGVPRRRRRRWSAGGRSHGPLPAGSGRRTGTVSTLLVLRSVRYVTRHVRYYFASRHAPSATLFFYFRFLTALDKKQNVILDDRIESYFQLRQIRRSMWPPPYLPAPNLPVDELGAAE